jgi:hypothetical protein
MLKSFFQWLAFTLAGFGSLSGGYHFYLKEYPSRVLVVVDTSYPMKPDEAQVRAVLDEIDNRRYTEFSLYTEKAKVHGWLPQLTLGNVTYYAPRDWSQLTGLKANPEFSEASDTILITNDPADPKQPGGWKVMRLE